MGSRGAEIDDQPTADSTPEDVAVLYSWANLQGAKYRDYSASRREYRAQVRYRAAKTLLEHELTAQADAEESAGQAERAALAAEATARSLDPNDGHASLMLSLRSVEAAARMAAEGRVEAARRSEAAAHAAVLALREEREIAEAHESARRQAAIYAESELRRRQLAGPQPRGPVSEAYVAPDARSVDFISDQVSYSEFGSAGDDPPTDAAASREANRSNTEDEGLEADVQQTSPAWLYASHTPPRARISPAIPQSIKGDMSESLVAAYGRDTLQDSRERVASRWFALKGVFEHAGFDMPVKQPMHPGDRQIPVLAIFSLAGGVGKTSLAATLGRTLSSQGEKVLLIDTTSHGLLPFYFGARELDPGVVRAFSPPGKSTDQPVSLVICDVAGKSEDERQQEMLTEEILRNSQGNHRLVLDLSSGSSWLVRRMANQHPTVLVPIAPDMNSVISLQAVERLFRGVTDTDGRSLLPFYVLNQFDAALPLHLDVREVFRRQLGDRLLPLAIRRSPAVSEALAEGMTVVDYTPAARVSQDYFDVASWLRSVSPPATAEIRSVRWGPR